MTRWMLFARHYFELRKYFGVRDSLRGASKLARAHLR